MAPCGLWRLSSLSLSCKKEETALLCVGNGRQGPSFLIHFHIVSESAIDRRSLLLQIIPEAPVEENASSCGTRKTRFLL